MLPRRLLPWLFALALLLGQATAFAHAIGHLHQDDADGADPVCELCVAQSHLGHAAPPAAPHLPLVAMSHAAPDTVTFASFSVCPRTAQARAPPVSA